MNQQTVWKVIRKHNTHHKPIPPLNGASNCVVIPKEGKNDYTVLASYRPISMSAGIGKVMESLTARRLSAITFRCSAMLRTQMGGIQDNSATDAFNIHTYTNE
jgi:hypothetical protein